MNKEQADKIITQYLEKIFSFARSKAMNTEKAEELASMITVDVYTSLLKADSINNIDGYIYRVARNVYARFVDEEVKGRHISLDEVRNLCEEDFTNEFDKDETIIRLRREISYLGMIQRETVFMYYFQKLKQYEIAERFNIPLGTVKWHLHDARNNIKEGMNTMREKGTLGMKPIKFTQMGHSGYPAPDGKETSYYLQKLISQNIAYAAYYEAKTITEIAEEIGTPAAFVENEVAYLEENGFMDRIEGGKYLTNIYISEWTKEVLEEEHEVYMKYAKIVCEKYVPLVFNAMADYKAKKIYVPEDDFNFFMWTAVTYACGHRLYASNHDMSKYRVKRIDGGDYFASASVQADFKVSYNSELYDVRGDMHRMEIDIPIRSWQLNTYYDDREGNWTNNRVEDYIFLYEFITGRLPKDMAHVDKFKRLFDKGYIVTKGGIEYVNMIVTTMSEIEFAASLPAITEELKVLSEKLDAEIYRIEKNLYPSHMQSLCREGNSNCLSSHAVKARVLELLYADGALKPLTDTQKHSVNTIMFCDTLPE